MIHTPPLRSIPPDTAPWARNCWRPKSVSAHWRTLYEQYHDEDFIDLYHKEGKPALSPVLLAFVTIFQT